MAAFPRATALAVVLSLCLVPTALVVPTVALPTRTVVRAPGDAVYDVRLSSGPRGRTWTGTEEIAFTNTGDHVLGRVWLRLWSNGVQGCHPAAIRITDIEHGTIGASRERCTAVPIDLDSTIAPGARIALRMGIRIQVPLRNDRFGAHGGAVYLGTVLPTLAVHDDDGWHLDRYVALGESFYSLAARYRVRLNVPAGLQTPATGTLARRRTTADRAVRTYAARDVRDFAWAAGRFSTLDADTPAGRVRVWYLPSVTPLDKVRHVKANAVRSMATFSRAFGDYPYREVDVVVSAFRGIGGMEYPQIVFANPEAFTVAHELAHQWWYGIVGDDQYADPWLDESFASWSEYLPITPWTSCPHFAWPSVTARLTNDMTYWRAHPHEYRTVYVGGGCMLANLARRVGMHAFTGILARYADRHWLGVVRPRDFQGIVERAAARRLPGFDPVAFWARWRVD